MKTKTIKQTVTFKASPEEVYSALMDSRKHSAFTGDKAIISKQVGGKISAYSGGLVGKNLELTKNKRIVQAWRCVMEEWPKTHYSKATFSLKKVKNGTRLTFTQIGVPEECYESIKEGWYDYYWNPMKAMLESQ